MEGSWVFVSIRASGHLIVTINSETFVVNRIYQEFQSAPADTSL